MGDWKQTPTHMGAHGGTPGGSGEVAEKLHVDGLYSVREERLGYVTLGRLPDCSSSVFSSVKWGGWCAWRCCQHCIDACHPRGHTVRIQSVHLGSTPKNITTPRVRFHRKLRVPKFTCSACAGSNNSCLLPVVVFLRRSRVLMTGLQWKSGVKNHKEEVEVFCWRVQMQPALGRKAWVSNTTLLLSLRV